MLDAKQIVVVSLIDDGILRHLLIVPLQRRQVLPCLRELAFLHALAHVPVHEGPLGKHGVELVIQPREQLGDGAGIGNHAGRSHEFAHVGAGGTGGRLQVDAHFEPGGAPVYELNCFLRADGLDGFVDVSGDDVASVHHGAGHVLAQPRVAPHHHVARLKQLMSDLFHRQAFKADFFAGSQRGIGGLHEVDPRVGHQISLELVHVHIEGTLEPE